MAMRSRDEILALLLDHREELRRDFGVEQIALFGSAARNASGPGSDIDVLVDIPHPLTLFQLVALRLRLEEVLDTPRVDVVLRDSILAPLRDAILAEAVSVA
ncbi:MAG TPA: nucleotidyltransferase family protein [Thermoanaerobaculia bacterium]|nr:nucleotidyltransferase family protein [Thermoanaerobaculia bacterium]